MTEYINQCLKRWFGPEKIVCSNFVSKHTDIDGRNRLVGPNERLDLLVCHNTQDFVDNWHRLRPMGIMIVPAVNLKNKIIDLVPNHPAFTEINWIGVIKC